MGYCDCCLGMHFCCSYLLLLLQLLFLCVYGQNPNSDGFINLDCGNPGNKNYVDGSTGLTYISDDQFIDTGILGIVSSRQYPDGYPYLAYLRSFPNDTKNCYTITEITEGSKYLVRAWFYYGNYDQQNTVPIFDLYFGVNFWLTVGLSESNGFPAYEIIAIAPTNYIQVCLVNTGLGTPFISALEVRPLNSTLYELANSTQSLNVKTRKDMGSNNTLLFRYPNDEHDRLWASYYKDTSWTAISTSSSIENGFPFEIPSLVLQTAVVSSTSTSSLELMFNTSYASDILYVVLHFAEIQIFQNTSLSREFNVYADGVQKSNNPVSIHKYLKPAYYFYTDTGNTNYILSLKSSPRATLPPILNAFEIYVILPVTMLPTDNGDFTAINSIKTTYSIRKVWSGDPCVPTRFCWSGINCTLNPANISRITTLNLSASGLTGELVSAFANLTELETLDLSQNELFGDIPSSLDQLTSLKFLSLSENSGLSRTLPPGLKKKQNDGQLTVIFNSSSIGPGHKISWKAFFFGVVAVLVLVLIVGAVALFHLYMKKNRRRKEFNFDKKQFSHAELKLITKDFSKTIGIGGFGKVFKGQLGDGIIVAVKVSSELSTHGIEQFLNEVEKLSRVHHKNLVSLIGYCKDKKHIALVYEFMQGGNFQDWLRGNVQSLSWKQRLQIAYESAQGLEYLHKMCDPPLIHRDVKTSNILLTRNLVGKVSDFGLVRDFSGSTHVSTKVAGTRGYLDPYYASTNKLTEKSDVYSFGVVLLEIVTGKPPIGQDLEVGLHLTQFVQQMLSKQNIESLLDPNMGSQYNLNSISKVTDLALRCTDHPTKRPDMTIVVRELNDNLNLEKFSNESSSVVSGGTSEYSGYVTCNNPVGGVNSIGSFERSTTATNLEKFSIGTG